ncbi:type II toxin-antitoxin system VapC family toxin [Algicella marina]|uniref:Uncharacterized protein n=1 Tax=Algicella marina TaxID=2683284 RepID=A0A6P1T5L1_9RHOB|nr:type II toxin-antitoxin system VapC family toxin [Algicella marina]QHQ36746.1 hypothetical protein GO499_16975 [Algicella marina]
MRFVISTGTAMRLTAERLTVAPQHRLVAPTLLRSQLLSELYQSVQRGEFDRTEAAARLDHMRALKIRLLGDRVLQKLAWDIAAELGWQDTLRAEFVALTKLQADAFVTLEANLASSLKGIVPLARFDDMLA